MARSELFLQRDRKSTIAVMAAVVAITALLLLLIMSLANSARVY